jgi:GT2 family glycosyltransferase
VLTTSVVICAYTENRWEQLVAAVDSVAQQTVSPDEAVVVIDHNEALLERATRELTSARVVANTGSRGLAGARNTGIAETRGDVVFFLDDDAAADPDWVELTLRSYADEKVLGVGGAADPIWESPPPRWWPQEFMWVVGCSYVGQAVTEQPVRNMMGCNMSVRRTVFEAVGGFDESLGRTADAPLGCEETELCIRARQQLTPGVFILQPRARVRHNVTRTRTSWGYFLGRCKAEGTSKAWVAERVGREAALAEERGYVSHVLTRGVAVGLRDTLRGDVHGLLRAGAIVIGTGVTAFSYFRARSRRGGSARRGQESVGGRGRRASGALQ